MARFYAISVQPTLFGEVSVLRHWGRIGRKGSGMIETFENASEAKSALAKLKQHKCRRGYIL